MITPWLLIVLYWLSVLFFIVFGVFNIVTSLAAIGDLNALEMKKQQQDALDAGFIPNAKDFKAGKAKKQDAGGVGMGTLMALGGVCSGIAIMIFGPIVSRVYFEILIVNFRMNATLIEIRDKIRR